MQFQKFCQKERFENIEENKIILSAIKLIASIEANSTIVLEDRCIFETFGKKRGFSNSSRLIKTTFSQNSCKHYE